MFSKRLAWGQSPNALSGLLASKRATGTPLLDLTISNATQAGLSYPEAQIFSAFANPEILDYNPDSRGSSTARQHLGRVFHLDPEQLILTSSTSEAYSWLFKLLCDPGDEVLVPQPSYPLFYYLAALENVEIRHYPLRYHGAWSLDLKALTDSITPKTRAIVAVNPNNPTGSYLSRDELAFLDTLCQERHLALISDEVFAPYALNSQIHFTSAASIAQATTFSLNGLSKLAGMPQMKLGWIHTNDPEAYARLELIADTYLSVGTPVQCALPELLQAAAGIQSQILSRIRGNFDVLARTLSPRTTEGGWSAVLQIPRTRSEEQWVLQLLADRNLLVQPGYFYDFESEAFLILSLLTPPEIFEQGLEQLQAVLP